MITAPELAPSTAGMGDDLNHITCVCDDNLALCGTDVTYHEWVATAEVTCVVCRDLEDEPCPRCGE